jgi:hypothetical protein
MLNDPMETYCSWIYDSNIKIFIERLNEITGSNIDIDWVIAALPGTNVEKSGYTDAWLVNLPKFQSIEFALDPGSSVIFVKCLASQSALVQIKAVIIIFSHSPKQLGLM